MRNDFFEEEVICGYTVSAEMKRRWGVSLDLLEQFMAVCDKHRLRYYAVFGTLLGALRHKGFIPWDDDIDIAMPRSDFEMLERIAPDEFKYPYFFQTTKTDPLHFTGIARLRNSDTTHISWEERFQHGNRGCFIDILVLDPLYENSVRRAWQRTQVRLCRRMLFAKQNFYDHYFCSITRSMKVPFILSKILSRKKLAEWYYSSNMRCPDEASRYVGVLASDNNYCFDNAIFESTVFMDFEQLSIPLPAGYKRFAEIVWGDIELPEDGERVPHHGGIINVDIPYTDEINQRHINTFKGITDEKILLFGAGIIAGRYIRRHGKRFPPVYIFDNDPKKWGTKRCGILVKNPAELPELANGNVRLIISSGYYEEIGKQLEDMGIHDYYIYEEGKKYAKI